MKKFTSESMLEIYEYLRAKTSLNNIESIVEFEVVNPDLGSGKYAGERLKADDIEHIYRSYKAWSDLAQLLFCRMLTPKIASKYMVIIRFEKLNLSDSFHKSNLEDKSEKYGINSPFFDISKGEEPAFLVPFIKALKSVGVESREKILNLGVNRGDEFELIGSMLGSDKFKKLSLTGIDHSHSAISYARELFSEESVNFFQHDINSLDELSLGRFDLIVSIGTLQSQSVEFKPLFMSLVQRYLKKDGAMILGFPNSRWIDGEMVYGAKAPNYSYSEMSLLYKDVYFCKKYLQQKKFRVTLTGRDYIFMTATSIR